MKRMFFFASTKNCARFFLAACKTWYNFLVKIWGFPLLTEFLDLVYFLTAKPRPSKALLTTKYTQTYTEYASTTGDAGPSRPLLVGGVRFSRSLLRKVLFIENNPNCTSGCLYIAALKDASTDIPTKERTNIDNRISNFYSHHILGQYR